MQLTGRQRPTIATRVAALEAGTGTQVIAAIVGKSDFNPEAPWKAFALGAAAAPGCVIWQRAARGWSADAPRTGHVPVILARGALPAVLTSWLRRSRGCSSIACAARSRRRSLPSRWSSNADWVARAGAMGRLLAIGLFEREVVILAETGGRAYPDHGSR